MKKGSFLLSAVRFPILAFSALLVLLGGMSASAVASTLEGQPAIDLPGSAGAFDFMAQDPAADRILAAHRGTRTLEIIDLASGKPLAAVNVGAAQGVAVDVAGHRYFAGNEADKSVVAVDAKTLKKTAEVKVDGPVDAIAFDSKRGRIYAAEDDGLRLWVIDATAMQITAEVKIPGAPEFLEYDSATDHLYLNIKDKDVVVRIDPKTNRIDATWPTAPATSPHGLAIDSKMGRLFSAGGNGKLVEMDIKTGKVLASAEIAPRVDQIAYDASKKRIYGAGKLLLSITEVGPNSLQALASVPSPKGAHTLAVDSKRHDVWVSFTDEKNSHLKKFASEN